MNGRQGWKLQRPVQDAKDDLIMSQSKKMGVLKMPTDAKDAKSGSPDNAGTDKKLDPAEIRNRLQSIYSEVIARGVYYNSRSSIAFEWEDKDGNVQKRYLDPMVGSAVTSGLVPKSCVLYRGGHGGGKTSLAEEVSSMLTDINKKEIVSAMIRGNNEHNINTLIAYLKIGKLLAKGEEEIVWRKFVTCPVKIIDEINRFPPTAANALFEILNKGRVEYLGEIYDIPDFEVFATENPEDEGTYPMSKPFVDRFGICVPVPQLPSTIDQILLASRKDDKIFEMENGKYKLGLNEIKAIEKHVAQNVKMSKDALLYSIYLTQALTTCERGDLGIKERSKLPLSLKCKSCNYDTVDSLCKMSLEGISGRAFLELQRWSKAFAFFLDAFKDSEKPEVQQSIVEAVAPYVFYHRLTPNDDLLRQQPYFGQKLAFIKDMISKASTAYGTVKEAIKELPDVMSGKIPAQKSKLRSVRKDLVVTNHIAPLLDDVANAEFKAFYKAIQDKKKITDDDLLQLRKTLSFSTKLSPVTQMYLQTALQAKKEGVEYF